MISNDRLKLIEEYARSFGSKQIIRIISDDLVDMIEEIKTLRDRAENISVRPLTRNDLSFAGFTQEEIDKLSDEEIQEVADTVQSHLGYDVFWDEVIYATRNILETNHASHD